MLKNDKSYSFLLSHSSTSRIYIKRFAISKGLVHFGSMGVFFVFGIATLGLMVGAVVTNPAFADTVSKTSAFPQIAAQPLSSTEALEQIQPAAAGDLALNSGGPEENDQASGEDAEIDSAILAIRKTADPMFLPTMWAHLGKINNEFGFRRNPFGGRAYEFHPGIDIDGLRGEQVIAPANGTVIWAGYKGGYGNMVEIDHGNGLTTRYGHLSKIESTVGETITRGQLLGLIGSTGRSTGPHLHFELRLNDRPINPRHFLPQEPADLNSIAK